MTFMVECYLEEPEAGKTAYRKYEGDQGDIFVKRIFLTSGTFMNGVKQ